MISSITNISSICVTGGNDYDGNRHYYGFDAESLEALFMKHGLEVLSVKPGIPWEERKRDVYCPMVVATAGKI